LGKEGTGEKRSSGRAQRRTGHVQQNKVAQWVKTTRCRGTEKEKFRRKKKHSTLCRQVVVVENISNDRGRKGRKPKTGTKTRRKGDRGERQT